MCKPLDVSFEIAIDLSLTWTVNFPSVLLSMLTLIVLSLVPPIVLRLAWSEMVLIVVTDGDSDVISTFRVVSGFAFGCRLFR